MRACANGKKEIATILYHWNSAAAGIKNTAGLTAAQLAGMSSCPEFREELEKLEQQKRQEQIEPLISSKHIRDSADRVIFVKPVQRQQQRGLRGSFIRAPSLDRQLHIPGVSWGQSIGPLGTTSSLRSALASIRNLREGSEPGDRDQRELREPPQVIRLRLRKQPSVDSGINLDAQQQQAAVRNIPRDIKQLSKWVYCSGSDLSVEWNK